MVDEQPIISGSYEQLNVVLTERLGDEGTERILN